VLEGVGGGSIMGRSLKVGKEVEDIGGAQLRVAGLRVRKVTGGV